jgi:hypothetical protein
MEGTKGAVVHTCSAFHASVFVNDYGLFIVNDQNSVRADLDASAATFASFRKQFQCRHIK